MFFRIVYSNTGVIKETCSQFSTARTWMPERFDSVKLFFLIPHQAFNRGITNSGKKKFSISTLYVKGNFLEHQKGNWRALKAAIKNDSGLWVLQELLAARWTMKWKVAINLGCTLETRVGIKVSDPIKGFKTYSDILAIYRSCFLVCFRGDLLFYSATKE